MTRFWFFLTTYPPVLTFSMVWTLTKSGHFWTTYLPCLVNIVCERPLVLPGTKMGHTLHTKDMEDHHEWKTTCYCQIYFLWHSQLIKASYAMMSVMNYKNLGFWTWIVTFWLRKSFNFDQIPNDSTSLLKWDSSFSAVTNNPTQKIYHPYFHWYFYQNT